MDYLTKLFKYRTAGVREYWIVNPLKHFYNFVFKSERNQKGDLSDFLCIWLRTLLMDESILRL